MKRDCCSYVLMLSYVDENYMDIGGNVFPQEGFVEAKTFTKNIDITTGLNGILWGKTKCLPYEQIDSKNWVVIKTEISDDLITVDKYYNRYKFRNGIIVFFGSVKDASRHIIKNKSEPGFDRYGSCIKPYEIVGSTEWLKAHEQKVS